MPRRIRAFAVAFALALASSSAIAAEDEAPAEYRALAAEAYDEFQRGNYPEALALFERAFRVHPSARVLRAIAKCQFELRRYTDSIASCDAALAAERDPLGEGLRADVLELRERALRFTGTVAVEVDPPLARVSIDGQPRELAPELRLDLGRHTIEVSADGRATLRREIVVEAEKHQVQAFRLLVPVAPPPPQASHALGYAGAGAMLGIGLGGLVGLALWFTNRSSAVNDCNAAATRGAQCDNASAVATERDVSIASVVVSSALIASAAVVFILVAKQPARAASR
ncbi:MAG: tetratricopeptide repeat protein [Rubrivivax sp.]